MWLLLVLSFIVGLIAGAAGLAGVVIYSLGIITNRIDSKTLQLASDAASKTITFSPKASSQKASSNSSSSQKVSTSSISSNPPTSSSSSNPISSTSTINPYQTHANDMVISDSTVRDKFTKAFHISGVSSASEDSSESSRDIRDSSNHQQSSLKQDASQTGSAAWKVPHRPSSSSTSSSISSSTAATSTTSRSLSSSHRNAPASSSSWIPSKPSLQSKQLQRQDSLLGASEAEESESFEHTSQTQQGGVSVPPPSSTRFPHRSPIISQSDTRSIFIRDDAFAYKLSSSPSSTSSALIDSASRTTTTTSTAPRSSGKLSIAEVPMSTRSKEKAAKLLGLFGENPSQIKSGGSSSSQSSSVDFLSESDSVVFLPHSSSRRSLVHFDSSSGSTAATSTTGFDASKFTSSDEMGLTMSGRAMLTSSGKAGDLLSSSFSKHLLPLASTISDASSTHSASESSFGKALQTGDAKKKKGLASTAQNNPIYSSSDKRRRMTTSESKNPTEFGQSDWERRRRSAAGFQQESITSSAPPKIVGGQSNHGNGLGDGAGRDLADGDEMRTKQGSLGSLGSLGAVSPPLPSAPAAFSSGPSSVTPPLQSVSATPRLISPGCQTSRSEEPKLPANERFEIAKKDHVSSRKNLSPQVAVPVRIVRRETFIKEARNKAIMEGQRRKLVIEVKETFGLREPSSSSESLTLFVRISLCNQRFKTGYATRRMYESEGGRFGPTVSHGGTQRDSITSESMSDLPCLPDGGPAGGASLNHQSGGSSSSIQTSSLTMNHTHSITQTSSSSSTGASHQYSASSSSTTSMTTYSSSSASNMPVGFGIGLSGLGRAKWSSNELVVARVDNPHEDQVLFEVLNRDRLLLGSARLLLHDLLKDGQKDVWLPLKGNVDQGKTKVNACGEIHVILTLLGWEDPIPLTKPRGGAQVSHAHAATSNGASESTKNQSKQNASSSSSNNSKAATSNSKSKTSNKKNPRKRRRSSRTGSKGRNEEDSEKLDYSSSGSSSSGSGSSSSSYSGSSSSYSSGSESSSSSGSEDESSSLDTSSSFNQDSESSSSYIPTIRMPVARDSGAGGMTNKGREDSLSSPTSASSASAALGSNLLAPNSSNIGMMVTETYEPKASSRKRLSAAIMAPLNLDASAEGGSGSSSSKSGPGASLTKSRKSGEASQSSSGSQHAQASSQTSHTPHAPLSLQIPNRSQMVSSSAPSSPLASPNRHSAGFPSSSAAGLATGSQDSSLSSATTGQHIQAMNSATSPPTSNRHSMGPFHSHSLKLEGDAERRAGDSPMSSISSSLSSARGERVAEEKGISPIPNNMDPQNPCSQFCPTPIYDNMDDIARGVGLGSGLGFGLGGGSSDFSTFQQQSSSNDSGNSSFQGNSSAVSLPQNLNLPAPSFVVGIQGWVNIKLKFKQAKYENRWCVVDGNELRIYEDMYSKASLAIINLYGCKVWRLATKKHHIKVQLAKDSKSQWESFQMKPLPIPGSPISSHISPWFNQINNARKVSSQYLAIIRSLPNPLPLKEDSERNSLSARLSSSESLDSSSLPSSRLPSTDSLSSPTSSLSTSRATSSIPPLTSPPSSPAPLPSAPSSFTPPLPSSQHPSAPPKSGTRDQITRNSTSSTSNTPTNRRQSHSHADSARLDVTSDSSGIVKSSSAQSLASADSVPLSARQTTSAQMNQYSNQGQSEALNQQHQRREGANSSNSSLAVPSRANSLDTTETSSLSPRKSLALEEAVASPRVKENAVSGVIGTSLLTSASGAKSKLGDDHLEGEDAKKRKSGKPGKKEKGNDEDLEISGSMGEDSPQNGVKSNLDDSITGSGNAGQHHHHQTSSHHQQSTSIQQPSSGIPSSSSSTLQQTSSSQASQNQPSASSSSAASSSTPPLGIHMTTRNWRGSVNEVDAKIDYKSGTTSVGRVKDDLIMGVENMMVNAGVVREDEMMEYIRKEEEEERRAFVLANVTPLRRIPDHVKPHDPGFLNLVLWRLFRDMQTSELFANDVAEKIRAKIETVKLPPFLGNFRILHMDYGKDFIKLESIKVSATEDPDEVIIEADIDYTGGLTVHLGLECYINWPRPKAAIIPVTAAIKLQRLRGKLHILLPSSLNTKNSLCFVSPPNVEFDVSIDIGKGQGRRVSSIPKLKHFLFSFARQAAFTALVHPSRILWHWPIPGRKVDVELQTHSDTAKEKKPSKGRTQVLSRDSSDVIACKYVALEFFNNILNLYRYERLDQLFASDCIIHGASLLDIPLIGTDAILAWIVQLRHSIPDIRYFIDELSPSKNNISIQWTARGTFIHDLWDYPATGSELLLRGSFFFKVRDGNQLITEFFIFWSLGSIYGLI